MGRELKHPRESVPRAVDVRCGHGAAATRKMEDCPKNKSPKNLAQVRTVRKRQTTSVPKGHREAVSLCAEHVRQLGGESPLTNQMEVKV